LPPRRARHNAADSAFAFSVLLFCPVWGLFCFLTLKSPVLVRKITRDGWCAGNYIFDIIKVSKGKILKGERLK
jgi:hypothetical protein